MMLNISRYVSMARRISLLLAAISSDIDAGSYAERDNTSMTVHATKLALLLNRFRLKYMKLSSQ